MNPYRTASPPPKPKSPCDECEWWRGKKCEAAGPDDCPELTAKALPYRSPAKPLPVVVNDCLDLDSCADCAWEENGCCFKEPGELPVLREE